MSMVTGKISFIAPGYLVSSELHDAARKKFQEQFPYATEPINLTELVLDGEVAVFTFTAEEAVISHVKGRKK